MATAEDTGAAARLIEENVPFGSSILWTWMKQYYTEGGVAVWTGGDIPFHITNTPILAAEWAETVFALLRDFQRLGLLDPDHPIEIYELGPGTGRHAFLLLQQLQRLEAETTLLDPRGYKLHLNLAELGAKGLQALANHPQLQPYLSNGRLKLHQFDIGTEERPSPWSDKPRGDDTPPWAPSPNPVFAIANYVLDSLPYDVVRYRGRERSLGHSRIAVNGLGEQQEPRTLENLGEKIDLTFSFPDAPVDFGYPDWNAVLNVYDEFDDTHVPFPTGAMAFLQRMRSWSETAAVLLVADKSFIELDQLKGLEEPELVPHGGGFSFNANLHALSCLARRWGGSAWNTPPRDGTMELSHLVVPAVGRSFAEPFGEMQFRFRRLAEFHAVDRFRVKESIDEMIRRPRLRLAVDMLRLSGQDPQVLYELSDQLLRSLDQEDCEDETENELGSLLPDCLEAVFPVGDETDMAFEVGRVAYRLELYGLAERAFKISIEQFGEDPKAHFNLGLGWYYQHRWEDAEEAFARALELDPEYEDAESWLAKTGQRARGKLPESLGGAAKNLP